MKGRRFVALAALLALAACARKPVELNTKEQRVSYGIGVQIAENFKSQGIKVDKELVIKGMLDVLDGRKLMLTENDLHATMAEFQSDLRREQTKASKLAGLDNTKAGEDFLAENRTKEGVVTLASGLQYKIVKAGTGPLPKLDDSVECNYQGRLLNGKEFDRSYQNGRPSTLGVKAVIPGWREALQLMPVGSTWQLFIPSQLAYGERETGRDIGPNATLMFTVELLGIKPAAVPSESESADE